MIEIEIPKDIREYESKLIGPFTTRQLLCGIGLVLSCYLSYKAAVSVLGDESSLKFFFPMICAIPFGLVGWVKPYGMHFEKFAKSVFVSLVLAPAKRFYKIDNVYDRFDKIIDKEEKEKQLQLEKASKEASSNHKKSKRKE